MFMRDVFAEVAFDVAFLLDDLTDAVHLVFVEILELREGIDVRLRQDLAARADCRCRRCK